MFAPIHRILRSGAKAAAAYPTCRRRAQREGQTGGFTLLEMLVAVAILATLVSIIPRSFVFARAIINRSESWTEARLVADAVLNSDLTGRGLTLGTRRGEMGGHSWVATLKPNDTLPPATDSTRVLLQVNLQVSVSGQEKLEIETLRIGEAQ